MNRPYWLALLLLLAGCSSVGTPTDVAAKEQAGEWPPSVGEVELRVAQQVDEAALLDLGLIVFDPGIPEDESSHSERGIFPRIREVEARYLPVVLREALVASNIWGVVRVLPDDDKTLELRVTGEIIHSDGIDLVIRIKAQDATGRVWLDRTYHDTTTQADYPALSVTDPYQDIYHRIANDLGQLKSQLTGREIANIRDIALLRYAASLSPEAFGEFLTIQAQGEYVLRRLPAQDDPMMVRVKRIRNQEYLFIDTVNEQYGTLYEDMEPTYYLWRQYGREQVIFKQDYQQRAASRSSYGSRGSFIAMQQIYNAFRKSKELDQGLAETAAEFNSEVAPTVLEVDGTVFRLSGGLDAQYAQWREILRSIFTLETGLPASAQ